MTGGRARRWLRSVLLASPVVVALAAPATVGSQGAAPNGEAPKGQLKGVVFAGPYCDDKITFKDCRFAVLPTRIRIESLTSRRVVRSSRLDGRFFAKLRPGRYRITGLTPRNRDNFMLPAPIFVDIVAGESTSVILDYFAYTG